MSVSPDRSEKDRYVDDLEAANPKAQVTTSLPLDIVRELEAIGRKHNVRITPLFRSLALRGLAAYRRDGLVDEPLE